MKDFPSETPRLDPLPFIVADVLLVGAAALIGWQAEAPLGVAPLACISALVGMGAIAGLYPFVINHARRQDEALLDRANQIEALARTVGASAEQISIAVANLPAIADNAARQLKVAEQLPAELQARLANLQHQLSATASEENAALRHELDTLRAAETDKLAAALDGLARATADLARLETLAAKHSAALDSALTHLPRVADTFGQQAGEILRRETEAAAAVLRGAAGEAGRSIEAATQNARDALARSMQETIAQLGAHADSVAASVAERAAAFAAAVDQVPESAKETKTPQTQISEMEPEPESKAVAEEVVETEAAKASVEPASVPQPHAEVLTEPVAEPALEQVAAEEAAAQDEVGEASVEEGESDTSAEAALSNDGFTRLVATAYIGIGNKLFIRGDGPGLRTDKGVPLQFVSIGKWRWESAELLFPARVRLYKNDTVECTKLGEITLEPGHHHEVNAAF